MTSNKKNKIIVIMVAVIIVFGLMISIPSLAKLKNRNTIYTVSSWDGSIATSYKKGDGSLENPFVISNGAEFAFFIQESQKEENGGYEGKYFELSNDIIINSGVFDYSKEEGLKYTLENITYFVNQNTGEYYTNSLMNDKSVGKINTTSTIENFKGNLNGKSFTIFGLHISNESGDDVALFKNLEGTITDLYVTNTVVEGSGNVAGIAVNATNSTLNNLVYDGFVVNNSLLKKEETQLEPVLVNSMITGTTHMLPLPSVNVDGVIKSIKLIGEYNTDDMSLINVLTINGNDIIQSSTEIDETHKNFSVDLVNNGLIEVPINIVTSVDGVNVNFLNLKYQVEYYDNFTSGIIVHATNSILNNVINKADIYGNYITTGMISNVNETFKITQSYNTGVVTGEDIASGVIGLIRDNEKNVEISNVYNSGTINALTDAALIGVAKNNTGIININNSVNITPSYAINSIINSTIDIKNSYSTNGLTVCNYDKLPDAVFNQINLESLYTKQLMELISYNEFVSFDDVKTNPMNAWIYEKNSLPILYIDDSNDPIANLNVNKYSWSNLSDQLDIIEIPASISFSIDNVSVVKPIKEKYFYVSNSRVPLTEQELDNFNGWLEYDDIVTIKDSGYYVIYAKIVDTDGDVTYINSDILVLNVSGFQTKINMDGYVWENFKTNLDEIYLNKDINLTIYAHDDLISINSVEYYVSDKELTLEELNELVEWQPYTNYITIDSLGKYVVYAKVVNVEGNVKYVNTDYLLYNGYTQTLTLGSNNKNYDTNYITNKSSLKLTFENDSEITYKEGDSHVFTSNILLPLGTKITLIDKATNKVYRKTIETTEDLYGYNNSCDGEDSCTKYSSYPFAIFEEVGTTDLVYYPEKDRYNKTIKQEKYEIIVDFSKTNLVDNYYDISFGLGIKSSDGNYFYNTLNNTINNINIYSPTLENELLIRHYLLDDYSNQIVYYNSNSEININLTNVIEYPIINDKKVIATTYENKKVGLLISVYDENNSQINKEYLDNIIFEIGENEYFASSDNTIKINLGNITDIDPKTLKIKTKENSSTLKNGTYYIKINEFMSDDGYYYDSLYEHEIKIPLVVENEIIVIPDYSFNVEMISESVSLDNALETHLAEFNVVYSGSFIEPNIRVSLYQKDDLTAYNQKYTLINLSDYVSDNLVSADTNKYYVDILNPTLSLNLLPNRFNNNGYKYVFELYDGTRKISEITKYFIVR